LQDFEHKILYIPVSVSQFVAGVSLQEFSGNSEKDTRSLNKKDIEIKGPVMPISENRKERNKGFQKS